MSSLALRKFESRSQRAAAVTWVNALVSDGMCRFVALKVVGLTQSQYYRWRKIKHQTLPKIQQQ